MPTFARGPLTMSSLIPVEFPQNPMAGQQFDKFPDPQSFVGFGR